MPRRSFLSAAECDSLFALPDTQDGLIQHYTLTESDLAFINQHRGGANRLGVAVQLCYMRYPGVMLGAEEAPLPPLLKLAASQLKVAEECWADYGRRAETRREHMLELQSVFGFRPFAARHYREAGHSLDDLAAQTDKGIVLATALIQSLRHQSILLPAINVIERICAASITRATRRIYGLLTESLTDMHRSQLDDLLNQRENSNSSTMIWLRQSPGAPSARHVLEHINRLNAMESILLPDGMERQIHQNRLLKLAREGGQMTAQHLRDLETTRRYATLVAVVLADAINLGLTKMAESCPGTTYAKLSWLQAWHIRDETYSAALADLVNAQGQHPFARHWGEGTTSSDGQRFKAGGHAEAGGNVNPKYGSEPGVLFYTHVSDQYAPFHTKVINVGVRDATFVLDGLLYHESDFASRSITLIQQALRITCSP